MNPEQIKRKHPYLCEIAQQHANMVELAIMQGDIERARRSVEQAFEKLEEHVILTPATELDAILPHRIAALLAVGRVFTLGQLCQYTAESLKDCYFIDAKTVLVIQEKLAKYGWTLDGPEPSHP